MADKDFGLITAVDEVDERPNATFASKTADGQGQEPVVFDRYINLVGIVNFGFVLQTGWETISVLLFTAFLNGGPASLVYGCIISGFGSTAVALSLGEMASMDPNVGAQYRWSALFAQSHNEFWGLIQGWITVSAWLFSAAGGLLGNATVIQGFISFMWPGYEDVKQSWHNTLLMWALALTALFCNLFLRRILNTLETIGGVMHVLLFVAYTTILATMGRRSSPDFVFKTLVSDVSGWKNPGVCFNIGVLATLLPLTCSDGVLHMIDETKEPRKRVPRSMVLSIVLNAIMMFSYIITLLFFMGDFDTVSSSPLPFLEIYHQATGSKNAALTMGVLKSFVMLVGLFNMMASVSRLTWAFARDKGLPYSSFFSKIHPKYQLPLPALGLVLFVCFLLSFINIGSSVAFNAITSLTTLALNISYSIPIYLLLMRKLAGKHPRYGPFKLGRWGIPVNVFALSFCLYSIIWTPFPPIYPVTSETMNYAGPITIVAILLALADWFTTGKKRFSIPKSTYTIEMEEFEENKRKSVS